MRPYTEYFAKKNFSLFQILSFVRAMSRKHIHINAYVRNKLYLLAFKQGMSKLLS